jgi:DNA-binding response OmpR family regulator
VSNRKLLLADDSVTIQKVINLTFADEGIEVLAVGDGDQAMQRFDDFRPDIVLADVNMPGLNGYRICEDLRGRTDSADVPVILLVGSFEPFDEAEARRVGANDWITKPFQSIRQLVAKVTGLLESSDLLEVPPAETAVESAGASEPDLFEPENEDIDALYRQSIAETVELPSSFRPEPVLGDSGMDDDMIEMSYAGGSDAAARDNDLSFDPVNEPITFDQPQESPAAAASVPEEVFHPVNDEPTIDRDAETLPSIDFQPVEVEYAPERVPEPVQDQPAAEPVDTFWAEEPLSSEPEQASDYEEFRDYATDQEAAGSAPAAVDASLLEIPASDASDAAEYLHEEDLVDLDTPQAVPTAQPTYEEVAAATSEVTGRDDLSPEFIEAVARKVIEKISENVIRQIAWQVVPQVADSVIREKIAKGGD